MGGALLSVLKPAMEIYNKIILVNNSPDFLGSRGLFLTYFLSL